MFLLNRVALVRQHIPFLKTMTLTVPSRFPTCNVRLCLWLILKAPYVGTGMGISSCPRFQELRCAATTVKIVTLMRKVEVRREDGFSDVILFQKFRRSNSGTAYNQRTLVRLAILLKKGDLSLSHLWKVEKWPRSGYRRLWHRRLNAVIMSERLVKVTFIHLFTWKIRSYAIQRKQTWKEIAVPETLVKSPQRLCKNGYYPYRCWG